MGHACQKSQQKKNRSKYIDWLIRSKCGADLLAAGLFPNAKEVTESFACFEATMHLGEGFEWNNPEVVVFVVGDGHKPRTAATFACRTKWQAHSIDPVLTPRLYKFDRMYTHRKKIEDTNGFAAANVLIVMPHSHAKIDDCLTKIQGNKRAVITLDCCVKNSLSVKPDVEYVDENIWSPMNIVRVWKSV